MIQVSFVGTISNVLLNGLGPVARLLSAVTSLQNIMFMAVALSFLGLEAASFSTEIWHFYLTRGVLFGAGASFAFYVALSIVPQWFDKRRGIALGISSTGTCIGAFSLPFIMTTVNSCLGGAWSYRVQGFIVLVVGLISSHATYLGLSPAQGSALISIVSGMSFVGNLVSGITADHIGHINTMMLYCTLCALSCVIWIAADSFKTLVAFCVLAGFFGGAFIALTPSVTYVITGAKRFESGLSLFLLITVISMFGPNVSSAFEQSLHARPYLSYEIFTAAGYFAGAAVLALIKIVKTNSLFSKI
ncbi:major facilitator superfamily domain-containing protein [Zychaea mexicana]|uniref:major facilitator superfamily domain-containing protein n=1 Tax=Zychaea mexicana TaxID=64656 RepID=UPI0022FE9514|nr:major facilitator superfamily domain-containing protein [Zychaea mexicana]KAI9495503.1 major facilitator superfamily domain-containing protein [Zychaea mexicana]